MTRPDESKPLRVEAVLLDAGGVLLDLDYGYVSRLVRPVRADVSEAELSEAEANARREINNTVQSGAAVGDLWRDYFHIILGRVGVPAADHQVVIDELWDAHHRVGLWTVPCAGALEAVRRLDARGVRLGVVSNAEGQVERNLEDAGYGGLFETVVDSHVVGVRKPDPQIFRIALARMALRPEQAAFVGDLPAVDVRGARSAGLAPILVDRHDLYPDADVPRIKSLSEVSSALGLGESGD